MKALIISFKSRNSVQLFAKILKTHSIPAEITNTPRSISVSCGLSVKTSYSFLPIVFKLVQSSNLAGFIGIYLLEKYGLREKTERIY